MASGTNNPIPDIQDKGAELVVSSHSGDLVRDLPASENKKFYPALDGLRALAVLIVFYQHYLAFRYPAFNWGWIGVDIFFVLSGFLITGILYDTCNTVHRFRNFYVRRSLRIFPLYYAVLLIVLLLNPIFRWIWHPGLYMWPVYLSNYARFIWMADWFRETGIPDNLVSSLPYRHPFSLYFGHFWSLCVEEQFYLIWPPVVFLIKDRIRIRNICLTVCILSPLVRVVCQWIVPHAYLTADLLYRVTVFRADALLLGGLIALMLRGPEAKWLNGIVRPALCCFIAGFAIFEIVFYVRYHSCYSPSLSSPILSTVGFSLIDLFAAFVVLASLNSTSLLYRCFIIRPLRRLGQMSYGFYIFHDIPHVAYILLVARIYGPSRYAAQFVAVIAFVCTLLLSYLSFRFFETPFLRLKDRFAA